MAKITRYTGNLPAFGSTATGTNRTVFNDVIQSDALDDNINADFQLGWEITGVNDAPNKQDFNALGFTHGQLLAYLHQAGVAEYDASQEYFIGSVVNYQGQIYKSIAATNIGNTPSALSASWMIISGVILAEDFDDIRALDVTTIFNGQVIVSTPANLPGIFAVRNSAAHGLSDNGDSIIVINVDWYAERVDAKDHPFDNVSDMAAMDAPLALTYSDNKEIIRTKSYYDEASMGDVYPSGGGEYTVLAAAEVTARSIVVDDIVHHWLAGGTDYAAVLDIDGSMTPYQAGILDSVECFTRWEAMRDQLMVGGGDIITPLGFTYETATTLDLLGNVNMPGSFKIKHQGDNQHRFLSIRSELKTQFSLSAQALTVGQNTLTVAGFDAVEGDMFLIRCGDDIYDVNEEKVRHFARVEDVTGSVVEFSPPLPEAFGSGEKAPVVETFVLFNDNTEVGNVTLVQDATATLDGDIGVYTVKTANTKIGVISAADDGDITLYEPRESLNPYCAAVLGRRRVSTAGSNGRIVAGWGNKNAVIGVVSGESDNDVVYQESWGDMEIGTLIFKGIGTDGINIRGNSTLKVGEAINCGSTAFYKESENSTILTDKIVNVDSSKAFSIRGAKSIQLADGTIYLNQGYQSFEVTVPANDPAYIIPLATGIVTDLVVTAGDLANLSNIRYGVSGTDTSFLSDVVAHGGESKIATNSLLFGSDYPESVPGAKQLRLNTAVGWSGTVRISFRILIERP